MLDCGYVCSMVATFSGDIVEPSALTALSLFDRIGPHYTYILVNDRKDDTGDEWSILCDESEMPTAEVIETEPCFVNILYFLPE